MADSRQRIVTPRVRPIKFEPVSMVLCRRRRAVFSLACFAFIVISLFVYSYFVKTDPLSQQVERNNPSQSTLVATCFTPAQACVNNIVAELEASKSSILLQAYGFTSKPILAALVAAKQRGVDVIAILDKSDDKTNSTPSSSGAEFISSFGIPVYIDFLPSIAHNKVELAPV